MISGIASWVSVKTSTAATEMQHLPAVGLHEAPDAADDARVVGLAEDLFFRRGASRPPPRRASAVVFLVVVIVGASDIMRLPLRRPLVAPAAPAGRRARGSGRPSASSSSCVPRSTIWPSSMNRIWSACISELSRCEMMSVTRSLAKRFIARADALLGAGVDGGGRIVEHHHRRLAASGCARWTGAGAGRPRATRRARRRWCRSRPAGPMM